jgi:hypothetical protein
MNRKWLVLLALLSFGGMCLGQAEDFSAAGGQDLSAIAGTDEPPMLGMHWARGFNPFARVHAARGSNPNMTYHGGVIMPTTVTKAILWGPSWANPGFTGDKITGLDGWYNGFNGSNYARTSDEHGLEWAGGIDSDQ